MTTVASLQARAGSKCELCEAIDGLSVYQVPPHGDGSAETCLLLCKKCCGQVASAEDLDAHHWRCLGDSMWSQVPAVQVVAWRMLSRLRGKTWAQNLLDILFLDEEVLAWAETGNDVGDEAEATVQHKDSNGVVLNSGDTITLIKDLNVKGTSFTAKRGTAVRNISLVQDNQDQIEGRINGQQIVILTQFVKKSG